MITIACKSLATLCKDYEFLGNDKNQLAELIDMLAMGWSRHGSRPLLLRHQALLQHLPVGLGTTGRHAGT